MLEIILLILIAGIWILGAVISDLKKREIPNWINFSLIIFALGIRFFYSLFFESAFFSFFIQGLIGLGIFFILGNIFYYARIFAGGDAKLLIALGSVLPFYNGFYMNMRVFLIWLMIFFFVGMVYGIVYSVFLAFKYFNPLKKQFKKIFKREKNVFALLFLSGIVLVLAGFFESVFALFGLFFIIISFMYVCARAIDESCMVKKVKVSDLSEGDWLYKGIKIGRKKINSSWEGLTKKDIALIKKNRDYVMIKQGIPYAPVFLISFIVLVALFFLNHEIFYFFGF